MNQCFQRDQTICQAKHLPLGPAAPGAILELPALRIHKVFKREAFDTELFAYVRHLYGIRLQLFDGYNGAPLDCRICNYEGVCVPAATQDLPLFDVLLKVRYIINASDKGTVGVANRVACCCAH